MSRLTRMKHKAVARVSTRFPGVAKLLTDTYAPWESEDVPWTPVRGLLRDSKVAVVTTAGVHQKDQEPFDMKDPDGDPSFRVIRADAFPGNLMITHDYYDHSDADRDINIVFPLERLQELEAEGVIGEVADVHYGFMGHIDGDHIHTLVQETAPAVATRLKSERVDIVLLTPG